MIQSKAVILSRLSTLKHQFDTGLIPRLEEHEVNPGLDPGSRENYLYFLMTCCLNFQRSSPATWRSALATWNDETTRFVFFPEAAFAATDPELQAALLKHKLALQPNKHLDIWRRITTAWHTKFADDPRELLKLGKYDSAKIIHLVQHELKADFPYLSGPKLSNYFLFILLQYTDLQLANTHAISIIPDTHIMQATAQLGILPPELINPKNVEAAWRELLEGTEWVAIDFHSMLWNWSRAGFKEGH